jgi:hypothetical protein
MAAYATRKDVYRYGLARGTIGTPARLCDSASISAETITLDDHGFEDDDELLFRAADTGSLPGPLSASTVYYAKRVSDSTFQVAATAGGAAINLTSAGSSFFVMTALPIDDVLEFYSRFVDAFLPAHAVPLEEPYPIVVTAIVAELAARKLQLLSGQTSESMAQVELAAKAQLERWAKGIPLRDAAATAATNKAVVETVGSSVSDPRGWGSDTL